MRAFSRAGSFQGGGQSQGVTGSQESPGINLPSFPIKIHGKEKAGFIKKHGVEAHHKGIAVFILA
jgi:hypothetical protein